MGSAHAKTELSLSPGANTGALWSLMNSTPTPTLHKASTEEVIPAVGGQKSCSPRPAAQVPKADQEFS